MTKKHSQTQFIWEISIPLASNPFMLKMMLKVCLLSGGVMGALLTFLFAVQREFDAILPMLMMTAATSAFLFLLFLFVMLVILGNRMLLRFTVNDEGVLCETLSRTASAANRLAVLIGILAGKPGVAGAGMIGLSQEAVSAEWKSIFAFDCHGHRQVIILRNRWRQVMILYCTGDNFSDIAEFVSRKTSQFQTDTETAAKNPLPGLLLRTVLTMLACAPVFMLSYPFEIDLLIPLLTLCFALATVWLVPLFGYVVMVCVIVMTGMILAEGLKIHHSRFASLGSYRAFEVLGADEWLLLGLVATGFVYLFRSSWRAVRGRATSGLMTD